MSDEETDVVTPSKSGVDDEAYAYDQFVDLGLDPLESIALVAAGLSHSSVREFARKNRCGVREAVAILL